MTLETLRLRPTPSRTHLMPKALCYAGMAIAAVTLILFLLDLVLKIPFGRENMLMDIVFVLASGALAYLSWSSLRDLER